MAYTHQQAVAWLQEHNFPHVDYVGRFVDPETNTPKHIFAIDSLPLPEDFHAKAKVTQAQEMDASGEVVMYRLQYKKRNNVIDPAHINFVAAPEDEPVVMRVDDEDIIESGFDPDYNPAPYPADTGTVEFDSDGRLVSSDFVEPKVQGEESPVDPKGM